MGPGRNCHSGDTTATGADGSVRDGCWRYSIPGEEVFVRPHRWTRSTLHLFSLHGGALRSKCNRVAIEHRTYNGVLTTWCSRYWSCFSLSCPASETPTTARINGEQLKVCRHLTKGPNVNLASVMRGGSP